MARARNIKPGFFTNDELGACRPLTRLLFAGLWCHADRDGRLQDRPKKFKIEILPYDECDVDTLLNELWSHGMIVRYSIGEIKYIQILTFEKHQSPHHQEKIGSIQAPDLSQITLRYIPNVSTLNRSSSLIPDSLNLIEDSLNLDSEGKPSPSSVRVIGKKKPTPHKHVYSDDFEKFWQAYPPKRKVRKPDAFREFKIAMKKTTLEHMLDTLEKYKKTNESSEFSPEPHRWLKQERFDDEIPVPKQWWESDDLTEDQKKRMEELNNRPDYDG